MTNSITRWVRGKYALSIPLALLMLLNYPLTGFLLSGADNSPGSAPSQLIDILVGSSSASAVLVFALLRKLIATNSVTYILASWVTISLFGNIFPYALINIWFPGEQSKSLFDLVIPGTAQMFAVLFLFTFIIASLSETRMERKNLAIKRAELEFLREGFASQISEATNRVREIVENQLASIVRGLKEAFSKALQLDSKTLALQIGKALNEGVRPLSWNIEKLEVAEPDLRNVRAARVSLRDRLQFKVSLRDVILIPLLVLVLAFFDLPVAYFTYGFESVVQCAIAIAIVGSSLYLVQKLLAKLSLQSWLAITVVASISGLGSLSFLVIRALSGQLTNELSELAFVFSFVQITALAAIFQTSLVRRLSFIKEQRNLNAQLEVLVSQLRQNAWVVKKQLSRLVHGQVQSQLFSAYLLLSKAESNSPDVFVKAAEQIENASKALASPVEDSTSFAQSLESMVSTWSGALEVSVDVSNAAAQSLDADGIAAACATEVIREGLNNAAKYGSDARATVSVTISETKTLHIEVTNRTNSAEAQKSGYGSVILDEVTHEWHLAIEKGLATLYAEIILK